MPQPNGTSLDAWMDARVEAYIDDTLPPSEQARFEAHLRRDPYWEEQVERARSICFTLRSQTSPSPPTELTDAIFRHTSAQSQSEENT